MNSRLRVITALQKKEPDRVPVFEWAIDSKICKDIVGKEDIFSTIEKLDLDAITLRADYKREFIDENIYLDEWGCKKRVTEQFIDVVIESPIKKLNDFKKFKFPDPYASYRFNSLEKAVKKFGKNKAIIFNTRDIYSDLRDLIGYEESLIALLSDTENLNNFLDMCIDYNKTTAELVYKKFGIDILVTTDDIADNNGIIFGPKLYFDFFKPKFKKVIKKFKDIGFYCIKHCDGNIMDIIDDLISSGIDCIDPIDPTGGMDIAFIKKKYGKKVCIKGNVNCATTLVNGSLKEVEDSVKYCFESAAKNGGFILSSSNTIHSGVKTDNFIKMIELAHKYGAYPLDLNFK